MALTVATEEWAEILLRHAAAGALPHAPVALGMPRPDGMGLPALAAQQAWVAPVARGLPMANGTPSARTARTPRQSPRSITPASLQSVLRPGMGGGGGGGGGVGLGGGVCPGVGVGGGVCWGCGWGWGFGFGWGPAWAPFWYWPSYWYNPWWNYGGASYNYVDPETPGAAQSSNNQQNVVDQPRAAEIDSDRD